jgi:hypothetical protein
LDRQALPVAIGTCRRSGGSGAVNGLHNKQQQSEKMVDKLHDVGYPDYSHCRE